MEYNVGDKVKVISRRRPTGFGPLKGYEGIISNIWDTTLMSYLKGKNIEIEFYDDELRNFIKKEGGILFGANEIEKI